MRFYLVWLAVICLSMYSYKDWFKGLCFLVLLMAFLERPDMPRSMMGIPGLNPWNFLFLNVVFAAFIDLSGNKRRVPLPPKVGFCVPFYLFFILLAFFREFNDMAGVKEFYYAMERTPPSKGSLVIDKAFNPIKYAVPGLLAYYGCNSPERVRLLLFSMLCANLLIALQIIQIMPLSSLTDGYSMQKRAILKIDNRLGYFRSDAAIFLAGAAWGMFALQSLFKSKILKMCCLGAVGVSALAIALTGGRSGQGVFLILGVILMWFKWRRLMILGPIGLLVLITAVPSVLDRFTQGFEYDPDDPHFKNAESMEDAKMKSITSGRTFIWPYVIDEIQEAPFLGHGGNAMQRLGISTRLWLEHNESFPHPHNAYLQILLDNGIILAAPILFLYIVACSRAFLVFRKSDDPLSLVVGACCFSMIASFLIGGLAQQSFYPPSSSVILICAMGIALRIHAEKYLWGRVHNLLIDSTDSWNVGAKR